MTGSEAKDWTAGPAKWAAVVVLGGASITGIAWSILTGRTPAPAPVAPMTQPPARVDPVAPAPDPALAAQPARPEIAPAAPQARPARVNLNTASAAELELLPGIGPVVAARIVEQRTKGGAFKSVNDLDAVKGIGPKTIESLRPLVTVE